MPYAQPIRTLSEGLTVRQASKNWFIGKATINGRRNTFFARTALEVSFKYRAAKLAALSNQFHGGMKVGYLGSVYTIAMIATQQDGTPVAWLQGRPGGCIPLERLILVDGSDGVAA